MTNKAFTLVELIIAMFISMLIIFGIISTYFSSIVSMNKTAKHLRAQQEAISLLNQVGGYIRSSSKAQTYNYTPPTTYTEVNRGNSIATFNTDGTTSVFYFVNDKMYCIPSIATSALSTNAAIFIAKGIDNNTYFFNDSGSICFNLVIRDDDDTNMILFTALTRFNPRN